MKKSDTVFFKDHNKLQLQYMETIDKRIDEQTKALSCQTTTTTDIPSYIRKVNPPLHATELLDNKKKSIAFYFESVGVAVVVLPRGNIVPRIANRFSVSRLLVPLGDQKAILSALALPIEETLFMVETGRLLCFSSKDGNLLSCEELWEKVEKILCLDDYVCYAHARRKGYRLYRPQLQSIGVVLDLTHITTYISALALPFLPKRHQPSGEFRFPKVDRMLWLGPAQSQFTWYKDKWTVLVDHVDTWQFTWINEYSGLPWLPTRPNMAVKELLQRDDSVGSLLTTIGGQYNSRWPTLQLIQVTGPMLWEIGPEYEKVNFEDDSVIEED